MLLSKATNKKKNTMVGDVMLNILPKDSLSCELGVLTSKHLIKKQLR